MDQDLSKFVLLREEFLPTYIGQFCPQEYTRKDKGLINEASGSVHDSKTKANLSMDLKRSCKLRRRDSSSGTDDGDCNA